MVLIIFSATDPDGHDLFSSRRLAEVRDELIGAVSKIGIKTTEQPNRNYFIQVWTSMRYDDPRAVIRIAHTR